MGTRHLICVFKDGEYKVAQYGQWDGYPEGQGVCILEFLNSWDRDKFEKNVLTTQWLEDHEWDVCKYPHLSRDVGADILKKVEQERGLKLYNQIDFARDSLMCEWAYVIDLDTNKFEIYEMQQAGERFPGGWRLREDLLLYFCRYT